MDIPKVSVKTMKEVIKAEIDKIDLDDYVSFSVSYDKYPGQDYFIKNVSLEIEKRNMED